MCSSSRLTCALSAPHCHADAGTSARKAGSEQWGAETYVEPNMYGEIGYGSTADQEDARESSSHGGGARQHYSRSQSDNHSGRIAGRGGSRGPAPRQASRGGSTSAAAGSWTGWDEEDKEPEPAAANDDKWGGW
jgi:hypothetical protein